ncbi:MAG: hypothetical protein P8188_17120 [Gemmatimonadota bacterium]|jgi:hypothetical protein
MREGGRETVLGDDGREPRVSVLVPVTDPPYPLDRLYVEYATPLERAGVDFEFVFILRDRDSDRVGELDAVRGRGAAIRILLTGNAQPEGALPHIAAGHTRAPVLVTLPAFPAVAAESLPRLVRALEEGPDLVAAVRENQHNPLVNRLQRRAFHFLLATLVGGRFSDIANGVRAVRREVLEQIDLYGDFNRFLPMLAVRDGFRVEELQVPAHQQDRRTRVYNPAVYLRRLIDLVGLMFLVRFTYQPLRFFGMLGTGLMGAGGVILVILLVQRLGGRGLADRPVLLLAVLLVVMGVQALAMGLIGEIVVHHNISRRPLYRLREGPLSPDEDVPDADRDEHSVGAG